ncbi:MAG: hypothetical protein AAGK21_01385 [Bacteroidota bacterium]
MRTAISRLLLVGLLGLVVFVMVIRASGGGAAVSIDDLKPDRLRSESFVLDEPGTFALDVAGSYEETGTPGSDTTLAAYGWIVNRDTETLVWQLRAPRPERGTLVSVADTLRLEPGTYDAYFASYGDPLVRATGPRNGSLAERVRAALSRGGRSWVGDAGRWRFRMTALDEGARRTREGPWVYDELSGPEVVWEALQVGDRTRREGLLDVTEAASVRLQSITEITDGVVADRASIVRLGTRDTVWTASGDASRWAGGSLKNRVLDETVDLEPGLYRVTFETDRSHAYNDWTANPPRIPWRWGLSVRRGTPDAAVALLDPDSLSLPQIAAFDCVGPDETREAIITFPQDADVLIVAVGEITSGSRYDWARIDRMSPAGGWDDLWEMEDDLMPAGGASKNRRALTALSLEAGTYRLVYNTDESHDCVSGWTDSEPDGDLWGAALYALDADADLSAITVEVPEPPVPPINVSGAQLELPDRQLLITRIDAVGDNEDRRERLVVDRLITVTIVAAGELSESNRYDYATIQREDGQEVWSMTWDNTQPGGGGSAYHRIYNGPLALDPGTYVLRYQSDSSRSAGDFGPSSDVLWGVHVYRREDSPPTVAAPEETAPAPTDPSEPPPTPEAETIDAR